MERQLPDTISGINEEIYRDRTLIDVLQDDIARYERIISRLATENAIVNNANSLPPNDNVPNNNRSDYDSDPNGSPSPYLVRNLARSRNQNYYSDKIEQANKRIERANARILSCQARLERLIIHLDAMRQGSPHPDPWSPNRIGGSGSGKKKSKRKRSKSKSKTRKVKKGKGKKGKGKTFKK